MEPHTGGTQPDRRVVLSAGAPPGQEHHQPAIAVDAGSQAAWAVWQAYGGGREQILARACDVGSRLGSLEVVTPEPGWHASPYVGLTGDGPERGHPVAVWLRGGENRPYQVVSAGRGSRGWEQPQPVSRSGRTAVQLHVATSSGQMQAVWCEAEAPAAYTIWTARFDGQTWHEPARVTPTVGWVQRPEVALASNGCWVAWDAYDGRRFGVRAAFVSHRGEAFPAEPVSPIPGHEGLVTPEAWQFVPSVCVDAAGAPWVTWLCLQDVVTEGGVVDQWPVARVAHRTGAGWSLVRDAAGDADVARMAWGLLPHQGHGVWGYLGRRRKPLVLADPERGAWLLWERKELHDGRTPVARGVLCARRLEDAGERPGPVLAVATGPRFYVPGPIEQRDGSRSLRAVCRTHPDVSYTDVELVQCRLDGAPRLDVEERWEDWRPISVRASVAERRTATAGDVPVDGKTVHLYWADLHVHTALSADADGEVDEIIAYARDKTGLDCIAISDNDVSHLSLTASDWEMYRHYVRHFDASAGRSGGERPGESSGKGGTGGNGAAGRAREFVLLPAYEWTYRPAPRAAPNHRTVIGTDERRLPILRCSEAGADPMSALAAHAASHDLLLNVHHERWELSAAPTEANFEICSGWGSHMANPEHRRRFHDALRALAQGRGGGPRHRLGFVGNSDNHRRNPGLGGALTGIYATALTREAIVEALRARRCFATDGSRVAVRLWVNGTFMGQETAAVGAPHIRWEAAVPVPPATVSLVRDGETVREWAMAAETTAAEHVDDSCQPGAHYYYLAVEMDTPWQEHPSNVAVARGPHAWSSPVWVQTKR